MSINIYPHFIHVGYTTNDDDNNIYDEIDETCHKIYKACKGLGTDSHKLLKTLGGLDVELRWKVSKRYKELYGKELKAVMKHEKGNSDFGRALQWLAVDPVHAECDMIIMACQGRGTGKKTDERLLCSILCGRSNIEMDLLKKKFQQLYNKELSTYLASELSGTFEKLMLLILQATEELFDPLYHTVDKAKDDVTTIYSMGQTKWGTNANDEQRLLNIICTAPPEYMIIINRIYTETYKVSLQELSEREMSGALQITVGLIIGMKLNPYTAMAKLIKAACRGFGTDETLLTCCLLRYQSVIRNVMKVHYELYNKTVRDRIMSETSGNYNRLLMEIVETGEVS